ncbi:sigma-54-dependent transcriptional regulator [Haloferula sp.]|uniref:sigma-54-dependent transcriptional regulator n=1 Tax=Haloferula sp. TaxID=2497595 RepID=UPI00329B3941
MSRRESPDLLIIDDDEIVGALLEGQARHHGFNPRVFDSGEEALNHLPALSNSVEVVLLDLMMPGWSGFDCLAHLGKHFPELPVVILSASDDAKQAVEAMKRGAFDYVTKPFDSGELFSVVRNARRLRKAERENTALKAALDTAPRVGSFVARSEPMQRVVDQAKKVAGLDATVLLTGESGVGKGVLARLIHSESARSEASLLTVSCPALPRDLLESELFGHEKGAFTGATKRRIGKIEAAAGGSLFLDEIGDLSLELQPKLLSVLQDREFQRVGGEETMKADVRVIAATNLDLEKKIQDGEFREDLFYRLNVIPIVIPPLRERLEELPDLCESILGDLAKRIGLPPTKLNAAALDCLRAYDFPGNVRQLENALTRAAAFCQDGVIAPDDLPDEIRGTGADPELPSNLAGIPLDRLELAAIQQTLAQCDGNKAETARRLGISERTIYNKLKRHGLA